jgi:hypothetical protein
VFLDVMLKHSALGMISCKHVSFLLEHLQVLCKVIGTMDVVVRVI